VVVVMLFVTMILVAIVILRVLTIVFMMMIVMVAQNEDRSPVDNQAEHGDEDGLVEYDLDWVNDSVDALPRHYQRKNCQQYRTGKSAQRVDLSCAKTVLRVVGVATGVSVGKSIDCQSSRMRGHVQAIGQQSHRAKDVTRSYFNNHHGGRNGDDNNGTRLTRQFSVLIESVGMLPVVQIILVHID